MSPRSGRPRPVALAALLGLLAACSREPRLLVADSVSADSADIAAPRDSASPTPRGASSPVPRTPDDVARQMAPVWKAAADSGYVFRAVGQEPGWLLTIHPTRGIHWLGQYGEEKLDAPPVEPVTDGRGTTTYLATTAVGALAVTIEEKPCADAMSGEAMTHTVSVSVSGHTVHGCGRVLGRR